MGIRYLAGMNLEDHCGDVIRKAREISGITMTAAAKASGLTEEELTVLEETGQAAKRVDYVGLGMVLRVDGRKLGELAAGWRPASVDLAQWRELRMITTRTPDFSVNCYLVWDEVTREAALFDTGISAEPILELAQKEQLQMRHVFITHSHYDHVDALPALRQAFPKIKVHSGSRHAPVDQRNKVAEIIHLGGLRITHRETPGHAEDGVTYIVGNWQEDAPHVAIVGDTIFAGSMGNGNGFWDLARSKVREQILTLPENTLICPGHGPLTTVGDEKAHNPLV